MSTTVPDIARPLAFYRVMAFVTGSFLLVLTATTIARYVMLWGFEVEYEPFLAIHRPIAIVHGWIYVVYLMACAWLWTRMKWRLPRLLQLALGGIVPGLSFVTERRVSREVAASLEA